MVAIGAGEDKPAEAMPKQRASALRPRASVAPASEPKPKKRVRLASLVSKITAKPKEAKEAEIITFPAGSAHEFKRRFLEDSDDPEAVIETSDIQKRYKEDCARHGVVDDRLNPKALTQSLKRAGVPYSRTAGGKGCFHGVKWRDVPLPAAVPQGPRVVVDNTLNASSHRFASWG